MTDLLIIMIVAAIVGLAGSYVHKSKKAGKTCIGCPYSGQCSGCCGQK